MQMQVNTTSTGILSCNALCCSHTEHGIARSGFDCACFVTLFEQHHMHCRTTHRAAGPHVILQQLRQGFVL